MTISYSLAPNPIWYFADLTGKPLGGGYLAAYRSLNKIQEKDIFQDPAGMFAWARTPIPHSSLTGILFGLNGSQGPFYFKFDTAQPNDLYFLIVFDANGNQVWTIDNFSPGSGGGGSIITQSIDLQDLITNNTFWRNVATDPVAISPLAQFQTIAPGNHDGFMGNAALAATTGSPAPDICFIKNNTAATDTLTFKKFTLGSTDLTGDVTPVYYLNYVSNNVGGETFKCVQFPVCAKVQNLSNQNITFKVWARTNLGLTATVNIWLRQFFGDTAGSGASADVRTNIASINVTNAWAPFVINSAVPNVTGKTLGSCHNDGLFLQFEYPLGQACNIDFTKPSMFVGTINPGIDFHDFDETNSIISAPRTGDVRIGLNSFAPFGWVLMNDGTIGSSSSGATTRANEDTFPLFKTIYDNVSNTFAPVSGGRTTDAATDFALNKTLTLTRVLGRALAGAGSGAGLTTRAVGEFLGVESHVVALSEIPNHVHDEPSSVPFVIEAPGAIYNNAGANRGTTSTITGGINLYPGQTALSLMQPETFMNVFIKL